MSLVSKLAVALPRLRGRDWLSIVLDINKQVLKAIAITNRQ